MLKYVSRLEGFVNMLSYRNRLLLIGGVVTIAVLGTIFLQAPAPTLTVDQLMEDKSTLLDEEVAVRGEIRDGSINETSMTFILEGSDFDLQIDYSNAGSISNGLGQTMRRCLPVLLRGDPGQEGKPNQRRQGA